MHNLHSYFPSISWKLTIIIILTNDNAIIIFTFFGSALEIIFSVRNYISQIYAIACKIIEFYMKIHIDSKKHLSPNLVIKNCENSNFKETFTKDMV
jgi:hypothetical protein